jgi:hypothetical protein
LKTRDKLLGHVFGKLVFAKIDNYVVPQEVIFGPVRQLMGDLADDFYMKARKMPIDKFWKDFLLQHWHMKEKRTDQDDIDEIVDQLASFFYHKPELIDTNEGLDDTE